MLKTTFLHAGIAKDTFLFGNYFSCSRVVLFALKILTLLFVFVLSRDNYCFASSEIELVGQDDKLGYALGVDIGHSLKRMSPPVNFDMLLRGISDAYLGNTLLLSPNEAYELKLEYANSKKISEDNVEKEKALREEKFQKMKNNLVEWRKEVAETNKEIEEQFFRRNKNAYGVGTLVSGLQYLIIEEGKGQRPSQEDIVKIQYTGSYLNGEKFDSSFDREESAIFPLQSTIQGWQEILQMMPVGSKYRVFVPSKLAYGKNGSGTLVEPNTALIFEIELLDVIDKESYDKSDARLKRTPPYTDPAQAGIRMKPEEKYKAETTARDVLKEYQLSLRSVEEAADAFITLYNSLMPVSTSNNVDEICQAISTESNLEQCRDILQTRLEWLKSLSGLNGADFPGGNIERENNAENSARITWKEILFFADDNRQTNERQMKLWMEEKENLWKVKKIQEKF